MGLNSILIMDNQTTVLAYLNEDDRAYGLAGMAISVAALNASELIAEISIDSPGTMVTFSHEYYFTGSPSISPKATWTNMLRNFQVTSAMVLANIFARSLVRMKTPVSDEMLAALHDAIVDEGKQSCSLEDDEIEVIYRKILSYNRRIFGNPRLHEPISRFASSISRKRTLSGREIEEELHQLQLL